MPPWYGFSSYFRTRLRGEAMNRREFMGLCGALGAVYAAGARVRAEEGPRRVGMLVGMGYDSEGEARLAALTQALGRLGWTVGKNLQLDVRWAASDPNPTD